MRKALIFIGVGGLAFGIYKFYMAQLEILKQLSIKIGDVQVLGGGYSEVNLLIKTIITNNSEINFTLTGYDLDLYVNGKKVSKITNSGLNEKLEGFGSESAINFNATFSPQQFFETDILGSVINLFDKTDIKIVGKASVKKGVLGFANYPIDVEFQLADVLWGVDED